MNAAVILTAVLQILAQLPQDEQLVQQALASFKSDDLATLLAQVASLQAQVEAQHAAAQGM